MMKQNNIVMTVVIAVIVGAAAFFGGMKYQQTQASTSGNNQQFQSGQFQRRNGGNAGARAGFGGRGGAGRATTGEIISQDANSITVKLPDGSSKIVNLANSTIYSKTDTASKSDLKVGERIAAFGTDNSDGSITAQNVQLNPMFRTGPRPSGRANQPMPTR